MRAMIGKPPLSADADSSEETPQKVCHTRQNDITFGYTNEELKMPHVRVTGVKEMW